MLRKSAPSRVEDVIFLDFQIVCWTSPAIDLHNFFNTSVDDSLRPERFDELIAIYHSHLVDGLNRLHYKKPIPNFNEFKQQYDDKQFHGMK